MLRNIVLIGVITTWYVLELVTQLLFINRRYNVLTVSLSKVFELFTRDNIVEHLEKENYLDNPCTAEDNMTGHCQNNRYFDGCRLYCVDGKLAWLLFYRLFTVQLQLVTGIIAATIFNR